MIKRYLGNTGIEVPAIGTGIAAWGLTMMGYGKTYHKEDLFATYITALDHGYNYFDTAEGYANGDSERLLGEFYERDGRDIIIATKHKATKKPGDLFAALQASLTRLCVSQIDLYQLHYPPPGDRIDDWMDVMAEAVKSGLIRAVGVCNFNAERMKKAHERLEFHGIPLASNQIYYNLLERRAETNGVLALCNTLNVACIPFSPMAQGLLTGKYQNGAQRLSLGQKVYLFAQQFDIFKEAAPSDYFLKRMRAARAKTNLVALEPLFNTMAEIASNHQATISQVALNWLISTDEHIIPIPGAKNRKQVLQNIQSLEFQLTEEEHRRIESSCAA